MGTRIRWIHLQGPWDSVWKLRSSGSPWCDSACPHRGMASPRGPGAKHLANIMSQSDLHTPCGHTTETERLQATTCVPWSYHPPPSSLEERWGSREHFGTEKSNLQLLGMPQPV